MSKPIVNKEGVVIPQGTMEDFKRPDHTDFMTASELAKANFSGLRHNGITDDCEFWIEGARVKIVTREQVLTNPNAINEAFEDLFGIEHAAPDIEALKELHKKQGR